jgi:hypothetical protein
MLKKYLSIALTLLLVNVVAINSASGQTTNDKQARKIAKVKESVAKLGTGEAARVEVKLEDGRKFKGYIRETSDDHFVVVEPKSGATATVLYSQVAKIKGSNGLTAAEVSLNVAKAVGIVAAVAGVTTLLLYLMIPKSE